MHPFPFCCWQINPMSECFKIFTVCPGWGFPADSNAITHMQLLTQICQVLLAEEETHFWGQRSCMRLLRLLSARQDAFRWAEYVEIMCSSLRGRKGWGKGETVNQNL